MSDSETDQLLHILEAHGQAFLSSFCLANSFNNHEKSESSPNKRSRLYGSQDEEGDEEWQGIDASSDGSSGEDKDVSETGLQPTFTVDTAPKNIISFSDIAPKRTGSNKLSRMQMKAFMSSNISKSRASEGQSQNVKKSLRDGDDLTNVQNDALLHKLIHTKLLSSSLDMELNLPPAKKQKALAGRILELSGCVRIGNGEKQTRVTERNKAAKRVREGIVQKQREREKQQLDEAKNSGNYHPTLKKIFESSPKPSIRRRKSGLKMGVGKFSNGFLHLRKDDVSMATGKGRAHSKQRR